MVQADRPGYTGKGMGIAGLVCGIIAVIPALIVMLFFFGLFAVWNGVRHRLLSLAPRRN